MSLNNALCLITFNPNTKMEYLSFLNAFKNLDIYVIIDDNSNNYDNLRFLFKNLKFIQINDNTCSESGYINLSYITLKKLVTGWDKAIYYFSTNQFKYSNVWFFEDDVFFHSETTIEQLNNKYKEEDILCNSSYDEGKLDEWLWKYINIKFKPPYYCGMMCALRLSQKYLNCIKDYVDKYNTMFFLEAFFPTIAKHYNLKTIKNPIEFNKITHRDHFQENDILYKSCLYHPVKDISSHSIYRKNMESIRYYITTLCSGSKYLPIKNVWCERVKNKCKNSEIIVFEDISILNNTNFQQGFSGFIWAIRFKHNINLLLRCNVPVVMCDLDVIIEKDITPLVELPYDVIVSTETGGKDAHPSECSNILGFGICCGLMILKPSSKRFVLNIFKTMETKKYRTYDDEVNLMNYIVNNEYSIAEDYIILDNKKYTNKIINIDGIKICVLDFNLITREPILNDGQFANHINIDNVGGVQSFIRYFYENLEDLPLTCRCGKSHLGDNNICKHIEIRNNRLKNLV